MREQTHPSEASAHAAGMTRFEKWNIAVSLIWLVAATAYGARRTTIFQLLTLPIGLCFFATTVISVWHVFGRWRRRRWRSMLPLGVCFVSFFSSVMLARAARQILFAWALPSYEAVLRKMESGVIPVSAERSRVPQAEAEARLAYGVFARRDAVGDLFIEFFTEDSFPVKHAGYMYSSTGLDESDPRMRSRWPIMRQVRSHWYYVSD